jgi:hypothetical protein
MSITHLPASASADEVASALAKDGVAVVDRLVPPAIMDQAASELLPWMEATPVGPDDFAGRRTRRTGGLIARSQTCRDLVMNPLVLSSVRKVLAKATSFQLHLTQVIAIGADEPAQQIHRDQWAFDFFPFPKDYEVQCNTIWAMTDFTARNGATRVIPGSNHYDEGLRYLAVPLEIARTLPVELLRLMGYSRGAYALGYVDDLRDPIEVVRPDLGKKGLGNLDGVQRRLREQGERFRGSSEKL